MKKHAISLLTILSAITIIIVLGWAEYIERKNFETMTKQSPPTQIRHYDGGRATDGYVMLICGGIIIAHIYAISESMKKSR